MNWEDHESKRMEPAGSGATWIGEPKAERAGVNESTYFEMGPLASSIG